MVEAYSIRSDLLSPVVADWMIFGMFLSGLAVWVGIHFAGHRLRSKTPAMPAVVFLAGGLTGWFAMWSFFQGLGRMLLPGCVWPLWALAALASFSAEIVLTAYRHESMTMGGWRGARLVLLRMTLLALVTFILLDPILQIEKTRSVAGTVAVLMDDSESMFVADSGLTVSEKLDLAAIIDAEAVKGRVPVRPVARQVKKLADGIVSLAQLLRDGPLSGGNKSLLKSVTAQIADTGARLRQCLKLLEHVLDANKASGGSGAAELITWKATIEGNVTGLLEDIGKAAGAGNVAAMTGSVVRIMPVVEKLRGTIPGIESNAQKTDMAFYNSLSAENRKRVDAMCAIKRFDVATRLLGAGPDEPGMLKDLSQKYSVRLMKFGASVTETTPKDLAKQVAGSGQKPDQKKMDADKAAEQAFRRSTDIAAALEYVLKEVPSETLCGVVMLTDGRHNGDAGVDAVSRRLGVKDVPVYPVVLGGLVSPADAAVSSVKAPESIFLGDRIAVKAEIRIDGYRGKKAVVRLMSDGRSVADKTVDIPDDHFVSEQKFVHTPVGEGIFRYSIVVEPFGDERVKENNTWQFDVAVSGDRTNVLLLDGRSRWEFRYLRNLFFGRDKSVHLQYVLLNPDKISGLPQPSPIAASASRKFGDAEASMLPASEEEWLKFDVIIIGDIPPEVLDDKTLAIIRKCVAERGALLVVIAGPRYMPHAYTSPILQDMLPVRYNADPTRYGYTSPEPQYKFCLSPDGRNHIIMQQSTSSSENMQVWDSIPSLYWRHEIDSAKEGATVLAYAEPLGKAAKIQVGGTEDSLELSAAMLARQSEVRNKNALIMVQRFAEGRVAMLAFDETWRLRYRVGDTYHHRFWGQMMRWGAGESLRAGNNSVRLGSDRISYSPADSIHVIAKVSTEAFKPVNNDNLTVEIYRGNDSIFRKRLEFREGSAGIYETMIDPIVESGRYKMVLHGGQADTIVSKLGGKPVETEFIVTSESPIEMADLSASAAIPSRIAESSGGGLLFADQVRGVADYFGPGRREVHERKSVTLWDKWWILALIAACVTAEWIFRKRGGLA